MSMRLFVAIELPPEHVVALASVGRQAATASDCRPTAPRNLHVTACFLGDVDEASLGKLDDVLRTTASRVKPFELSFRDVTNAPPRRLPTMVWGNYDGAGFAGLAAAIRAAAAPFAPAMPPEKEALAHVTLVRFRDARPLPEPPQPAALAPFTAREIVLFESELLPGGPVYTERARYPLA
ncbi:MAG: RNA 2',3'-cyclic phosphodiesterase [Patescibacteria group bacterium]|nr:RNA 2',3'-cyclic phosphodiesterase [Patescibacteria group bacterium]